MASSINGLHHITAIASDPQATYDFYTKILGLRLVKKSVNQDDPATYHLFFGDKVGNPGMDLTFFTFQPTFPGKRGIGQVTTISLTVPLTSLSFWKKRLTDNDIKHEPMPQIWGPEGIVFYDHDDQRLELIGTEAKDLPADTSQLWTTPEITKEYAIRSFDSARLSVSDVSLIEPILTQVFGYKLLEQKENLSLYYLPNVSRAAYLEVEVLPQNEVGSTGAGTVHHLAFSVTDEAHQQRVRSQLIALGLFPTETIDRYYFKSVYFRTPAGILFELATEGPGFTADEKQETLGQNLALPPFLEDQRPEIEARLSPITL